MNFGGMLHASTFTFIEVKNDQNKGKTKKIITAMSKKIINPLLNLSLIL